MPHALKLILSILVGISVGGFFLWKKGSNCIP